MDMFKPGDEVIKFAGEWKGNKAIVKAVDSRGNIQLRGNTVFWFADNPDTFWNKNNFRKVSKLEKAMR